MGIKRIEGQLISYSSGGRELIVLSMKNVASLPSDFS